MSDKSKAKSQLIRIAGRLLLHNHLPSEFVDDYPQKTYSAARVAKMMEAAHDQLRQAAVEIRDVADNLGATWQPIETAPRDQRLLLWAGNGMYCGHWAKSIETDDEAWIVAEYGNEGDQLLIKATHWMQLPDPPPSL